MVYAMNLYSFNTTEFINPILLKMRGIIDNVTMFINEEVDGYEVDVTFWMGRSSGKEIHSVDLIYNDGAGEELISMERGWDLFIFTLGPFTPGTELSVKIVVNTYEGQVYTIGNRNLTLGNTTALPLDMNTLLLIVGAAGVVVVIIVVIIKFRKK